jgi:lipid A disaccharide synthetase|tara:strand:- start:349 stop:567 length:219 start_codon:yes stop_codon:yes gene_type:complete
MLKMKDVGLPNLLLGDRKYSELIQSDCNVANIIQAAEEIQENTLENSKYAELLRNTLIGKGNSEAAKVITTL